ncbi:DUF188 domain-containing protein [Macrococcoides caseolyticum]|uniref:DUF188 domain-containing protein n=1 Tax=Macrococcoides caseolyticum TaxID=69966 RepID=UPI001F488935|nr:DUF188 domain-containing protein [Macrococcus caseolyticus]MCE4955910.1 DUF188 domain-containing protein [Macrococcus caseolyticus]
MRNVSRIIVDADSSPVILEVIDIASRYQLKVLLVKDFSHFTQQNHPDFVTTKYVDTGNDSADYAIKKLAKTHDLVITGDYGLASLLLSQCIVMHHNGMQYTSDTIDMLLLTRYHNQLARNAKKRIKGSSKFTLQDRKYFKVKLVECIEKNLAT